MSEEIVIALVSGVCAGILSAAVTVYVERNLKLRTEFRVEAALVLLLKHRKYRRRLFSKIQFHVPGYGDEELRRLLLRCGAVRIKVPGKEGEYWGLIERNMDRLDEVPEGGERT
ncbi:hypothetical protein STRCI_008548 [Streptomyces cinnabarinus]|uniref:Uncharacterized protein n=1 Tax=Streptomyces cinnabarinus TaxID=67287 RepID=A0ABY7KQN4_9ACTN|nr:hypothetical protein [Streptomyces cinnabarinus]WAZ26882.1 hypothetical protein STRCI_008548 [Streptomyces cinnabarinus]